MADVAQELKEKVSTDGAGENGGRSRGNAVLIPAVATVATAAAAGLAAKKGPDLLKKLKGEAAEEGKQLGKRGLEGLKGGLASKLMGGGGGGQKGGKTRRLPIQRWTDVAVPVDKAYRAWTQFEEFPKFMHRVLEVKKEDQNKIHWREKVWFSTREWDGEITERRKNDRIAWKSVTGTQHSGVISFHKLDTNLTRVLVTIDFVPAGLIEKMASGLRFVKRAVEADLARFKAYVEFGDVRGLEYRSTPVEMEQHREDDDDEEGQDDRDRSSDREGRAGRREERRKALSAVES
jgi:uncharacterized membrane protein